MTSAQAKAIVALLVANWSTTRIPPEGVALRIRQLEPYDADVGREAIERVIETEAYWPPWSKIRDALVDVRWERAQRAATERGLVEPETSREQMAENAARMRVLSASIVEQLRDA